MNKVVAKQGNILSLQIDYEECRHMRSTSNHDFQRRIPLVYDLSPMKLLIAMPDGMSLSFECVRAFMTDIGIIFTVAL